MEGLPNELLVEVASHLPGFRHLHALCRVNHRFHSLLEPQLYRKLFQEPGSRFFRHNAIEGACLRNRLETVKKMVLAGLARQPPPSITDHCQPRHSPFRFMGELDAAVTLAAEIGNDALVELLASAGAELYPDPDSYPDLRLRRSANDLWSYPVWPPPRSYTPLCHAVSNGHLSTVQILVRLGAGVNYVHRETGWSALCSAAICRSLPIAEFLIKSGALVHGDKRYPGSFREWHCEARIPLIEAAEEGNVPMVRLLLENGADVDIRCGLGRTPLIAAACAGSEDVVRTLLEWRATVYDNYEDWLELASDDVTDAAMEAVRALLESALEEKGGDTKTSST